MPQFRYKAISADGQPLNGTMDAAGADEVIAKLQEAGHLPIEARRSDAAGGEGLAGLFKRNDLDRSQVLRFTQQLATLLGAGQPLDRALGGAPRSISSMGCFCGHHSADITGQPGTGPIGSVENI